MQVCTLLTSYLLRQYPAESAARAAEVKGEVGVGCRRMTSLLVALRIRGCSLESLYKRRTFADVHGCCYWQEAAWGVQAAEVDDLMPDAVPLDPSGDAEASGAVGMYTPTTGDFQCSHPNCSQLLVQPRVPVCGHPVCR